MADNNKIDDWEDVPIDDWEDVALTDETPEISKGESVLRGAAQGATLGYSDELVGAGQSIWDDVTSVFKGTHTDGVKPIRNERGEITNKDELEPDTYEKYRDESRAANEAAREANPVNYGVGEFGGGLATAFIPGLNIAKGAKLAQVAGKSALAGGIAGSGLSEADNVTNLAKDTASGAAIGALAGSAFHGAGKGISKLKKARANRELLSTINHPKHGPMDVKFKIVNGKPKIQTVGVEDNIIPAKDLGDDISSFVSDKLNQKKPSMFNKGVSKVSGMVTGVDEDSILRQIERPHEMIKAEADDFGYQMGQKALKEVKDLGQDLGTEVGEAGRNFLSQRGKQDFSSEALEVSNEITDFLKRHKPSKSGFSALKPNEVKELSEIAKVLRTESINGEDFFKMREFLDNAKNLAKKYDTEGKGPYITFLKKLRHSADTVVDNSFEELNQANTQFSNYKKNFKLLNLKDEKTAESNISNLFGNNKKHKQLAAEELLTPETFEQIKDISANKAFNAQGGSGSVYGLRNIGRIAGVMSTGGASELLLNPDIVKYEARLLGKLQQMSFKPMGKYAAPLMSAANRGPEALAATNFILQQQNADYRAKLREAEENEDND